MAHQGPNPDGTFTEPEKILIHMGSWPHEQAGILYTEHGHPTDAGHIDISNESEAPTTSYPQAPLDPGAQASNSTPCYSLDLNEEARRLNRGQTTSTFIAPVRSEPFNLVPERYSAPPLNSRDGYTSPDHELDPFLAAYPNLDLSIHYPQDGGPSQAQVDESVRQSCAAKALDVPEHAAHHHQYEAHSTSNGGLGQGLTMLMPSGQHATTDSRVPADVVYPAIVQDKLFHQYLGAGQSEAPQVFRDAATCHNRTQVVARPARPLSQRSPLLQPAFVYDDRGRVCSPSEHGHLSANPQQNVVCGDSAGAGQGNRATSQHFGALNYNGNSMTLQVPVATPSPHYRQHQSGSQASYETPQSTSDHCFGHSQPGLTYTSAGANQATPTDSIAYSHDGGSEGIPPLVRPVMSMKRSSDNSFTQQSTQLSYGSHKFDFSSPLATTPSLANSTKKLRLSGTPRSEADNARASDDLARLTSAGVVSPTTTRSTKASRQSSDSAAARPFLCEWVGCLERFVDQTGLRHHADKHKPEKTRRHKCPDCPERFRYPKDVRRHQRSQHASEDNRVECQYCRLLFSRGDNLVRHLLTCLRAPAASAAGSQ